jgi:hypothetical protein
MKRNMLYGEKIVKVIRDLDRLGIDKNKRRELIGVCFSFCGKYSGMELGLREGIEEAYLENSRGESALTIIEKTIKKEEDNLLVKMSQMQNYNSFNF